MFLTVGLTTLGAVLISGWRDAAMRGVLARRVWGVSSVFLGWDHPCGGVPAAGGLAWLLVRTGVEFYLFIFFLWWWDGTGLKIHSGVTL